MASPPKVTRHEGQGPAPSPEAQAPTPSQSASSDRFRTLTCTDTRGRTIQFRRLKPLERMRLAKIVGPTLSQNQSWMVFAALAAATISVDGEPVSVGSEREIERVIEQLSDEGLEAIGEAFMREFPATDSQQSVIDAAKN